MNRRDRVRAVAIVREGRFRAISEFYTVGRFPWKAVIRSTRPRNFGVSRGPELMGY